MIYIDSNIPCSKALPRTYWFEPCEVVGTISPVPGIPGLVDVEGECVNVVEADDSWLGWFIEKRPPPKDWPMVPVWKWRLSIEFPFVKCVLVDVPFEGVVKKKKYIRVRVPVDRVAEVLK